MYKKMLAGILATVMAFGLVACGSSKKDANKDETGTEEGTKRYAVADEAIEVEYGVIKIPDLKDVVVYADTVNVTEDDYKNAVNSILASHTETKTLKKGTVKKDSTVVVDFTGKIQVGGKKVEFEGGTAQDTTINLATDSQNYIKGFVSCLKGHKVGDKFTQKLKFPKDYQNKTKIDGKEVNLAGKDVWFTFEIKSLQKSKKPQLTDEFVEKNLKSSYGGVSTVEEFKNYVYKNMKTNNIMSDVWQDFVDSSQIVSYNESKKDEYIKTLKDRQISQIESQYQCTLSDYLEAASQSEEEFNETLDKSALATVKSKMVLYAIAKKGNVTLSDEDYKVEAATMAEGMSSSVEDLEKQYGKPEVEFAVLAQRVYDYFIENITTKEGKKPEETTTVAVQTAALEEKTEQDAK